MLNFVYLIPGLPLVGFAVLAIAGKRLGEPKAGWVGFGAVAGSFIATLVTWLGLLTYGQEFQQKTKHIWDWINIGSLHVEAGLLIDPLSMTMALFVTGVSALIHLYSIGYMKSDPQFHKFFLYMNLFVFSMLILVLAENFVLLFLGWEGVGACSYFLIGFWFNRNSAATAAKKAFIVNRIGDAGLLIGMFLIFGTVGTLSFYGDELNGVFHYLPALSSGTITAIGLLLLVGAVGKSAQLPLHVWLPDAMEGPTPVSALIHAATMVTAGVYLMVRCAPLLELSSTVALAVAIVGMASALFAATVACAQNDIKRVLAYSTMSQLGYMFGAVGAGAYAAGMFHMITHAFFKALLFLGAGAVIHALHEEQNLELMGRLRKYMPVTYVTFMVGWLAICGIFPLSGFWSKDEILVSLWEYNKALWAIGAVTVVLTAYYMTRLFLLAFRGAEDRWKERLPTGSHPHEAPRIMWIPIAILAVAATFGGLLEVTFPPFQHVLEHFLEPVFEPFAAPVLALETGEKVMLAVVSLALALVGMGIAALIAQAALSSSSPWPAKLEPKVLQRAWFVDTIYEWLFAKPGRLLASWSAFIVDNRIIDGVVNGTAKVVGATGTGLRRMQTGYVRNYALGVASGTTLLLVWALVRSVS